VKLSVIISVLNSHEILRRHFLYLHKMNLRDDIEFIILDDGSDPPLQYPEHGLKNLRIVPTGNTHKDGDLVGWTVELARNMGARLASGEYLLMTDVDYIIPQDAMETVYTLKEDKACFHRQFGVLDENAVFTQDLNVLRAWGLLENRIRERGAKLPPHPNNFIMRKETFFMLGCYQEDLVSRDYPNKGDTYFKRRWAEALEKGRVTIQDERLRRTLYMFPNGQYCGDVDYNPFGLFHKLSRKSDRNFWYQKMIGKA
jgi:glycosyltransferase involved in cell wall biosynthesis